MKELLHPNTGHSEGLNAAVEHVRNILIRDKPETYYAWVIAAFVPWTSVPARPPKAPNSKPIPPYAVEVARDSLRSDNKMITLLRDASNNWRSIIDVKSYLLENRMSGTAAEVRQQVGLQIRSWKNDWRICLVSGILQEVMQGRDFPKGGIQPLIPHGMARSKTDSLTYVFWQ